MTPEHEPAQETALPPTRWARVNLCVLWVGRQLSLLGGKEPIATTLCDRRRAITYSCASREALNSPGPHARTPPSLRGGYAQMYQLRLVTILV